MKKNQKIKNLFKVIAFKIKIIIVNMKIDISQEDNNITEVFADNAISNN